MIKKLLAAAVAFASIGLGTALSTMPAEAQERGVCLRNNRIWGWDVISDRTMIVTDRQRNRYTVRLSGGCVGIRNAFTQVAFRSSTSLGCLRPGDRVLYREPSLGRMSCFIRSVEPLEGPAFGYRNRTDDRDQYNDGR